MTHEQFIAKLKQNNRQLQQYINDELPRHAGKIAVDFFRENFIKGGFVDNDLEPWDKPKRYDEQGRYARQKYGTLLSARDELYNSISYNPLRGMVVISSDKTYAKIHNEGGEVDHQVPVTNKMRKFAWAMHFEEVGENKKKYSKWKGLALTKKETIRVKFTMPRRQFIGESAQLNTKIKERIINDLKKIIQ
ncbi:MAG: phage virion morphogenesis protein [Bacteroidales bacterium]